MSILKIAFGSIIGLTALRLGLSPILLTVAFLGVGLVVQWMFTRTLYHSLGDSDPVSKYGVRNLRELRRVVSIPWQIVALDVVAKSFGYASLIGVFKMLGWL